MIIRPGRDRRAVLHRPAEGRRRAEGRSAVVIGGGIAGISAATVLAEHGVSVQILEKEDTWGGRARSWDLGDGRSMSRGFHAFFRQYYTLRSLISRVDPGLTHLQDIGDYPLQMADGPRDSFRGIPRTPPWSVAAFALRSRSFPLRQLAHVDVAAAVGLLRVRFPETYTELDGVDAASFLDALRFPADARHLALEVFARSFFADPREFSAGELVAMFHTYFMGSSEGLIFDVPTDAYSPTLWDPLVARLGELDARARTGATVSSIGVDGTGTDASAQSGGVTIGTDDGELTADAVVLAADPRSSRALISGIDHPDPTWRPFAAGMASQRNAPPFAVWRLWLDRRIRADAPAFLGTSGFGPLDNLTVLDRFEATARSWAQTHRGSVIELHAYALTGHEGSADDALRRALRSQLDRLHPELRTARVMHEEWLVRDDCALTGTGPWADRPGVSTPDPRIVQAGDWLRTSEPVALMERAALTGVQAADQLLASWGVGGQEWWSPPMGGVLSGRR